MVLMQLENQIWWNFSIFLSGHYITVCLIRPDGAKFERQEIGFPEQRCLICGKEVWACARARTHSAAELRERTNAILRAAIFRSDRSQTKTEGGAVPGSRGKEA